ncbi:nucleoside-diphosphate-sugar epimerase [Paucibacter oligotrophus]|uniref:Nucleoside-diphosphate-sugar epimerase n=1 Tax=Roseateles oligotrophus TaxID=1769250 RepID=A0A840L9E5_9BURK|nr:NAD-dependent epimerase/dehydratase family protein [Roseateles oligotrophus]MBB4844716.1 nucleoside-diphosphate-sugar epimerase [Roseateles oligotrophus]
MQKTVLILGAAGRLGQALGPAFAQAGWQVLAQARKPLPAPLLGQPLIQALRCDALDSGALLQQARQAAAEIPVVINALNPPYHRWEAMLPPLAASAQATAQALGALLMLPGNVYNFGRDLPERLDLSTAERPDTSKARLRIALEARMAAAAAQGLDSVVLRAGDFFGGTGSGSWLDLAIASKLDRGVFVYPGPLNLVHAWAYLPDLAQVFVRVAERRAQLRGHHRYHFAGHAIEGQVLLSTLERLHGRKLKPRRLPWGLMKLGGLLVPSWRAVTEMRYLWERPHRLVDTELLALIGAPSHTALAQALRDSIPALLTPAKAPKLNTKLSP